MPRVLSLVSFHIDPQHAEEFLRRAGDELKAYWEAQGSERYDVYAEMGPTGPTGRLVEVNLLPDREAYRRMSEHVRRAADLPESAYRHVREPEFQVMEWRA